MVLGSLFLGGCSLSLRACVCQGHPATNKCFHIRQNVSQMVFSVLWRPVWLIWSCLQIIYLFGCLGETLIVSKVLGSFFVSSETASYPDGSD